MTQTTPRKTNLTIPTILITKMRKKNCFVCVVKILARGKIQHRKNKHGRIYTSTIPNKTIPCFLFCLLDFLVFGTVLVG